MFALLDHSSRLLEPSIGMQPIIYIPQFYDYNTKLNNNINESVMSFREIKNFSLEFSIDFKFNISSNTLEMIENNYNFKKTNVFLKKYKLKNKINETNYQPKIINITTNTNNDNNGFFLSAYDNLLKTDIGSFEKGSQLISIQQKYKIDNNDDAIQTIKRFFQLIEVTKENCFEFAFQFSVEIYNNKIKDSPERIITTNMFKFIPSSDFSYLSLEYVDEDDYFQELEDN